MITNGMYVICLRLGVKFLRSKQKREAAKKHMSVNQKSNEAAEKRNVHVCVYTYQRKKCVHLIYTMVEGGIV